MSKYRRFDWSGKVALLAIVVTVLTGIAIPSRAGAATPSGATPPPSPTISGILPEGLGAAINWNPLPQAPNATFVITATIDTQNGLPPAPATCTSSVTMTAPAGATSALFKNLCAKVPYVATVIAAVGQAQSLPSAASEPFVPLVAQKPSQPTLSPSLVQVRANSISASWSTPAFPGGKNISEYDLTATPPTGPAITSRVTATSPTPIATSTTINGLNSNVPYTLSLVAKNSVGTSPAAVLSNVTPSPLSPPSQPASLRVGPDGTSTGRGLLSVAWTPPTDPGGSGKIASYIVSYWPQTMSLAKTWTPSTPPDTATTTSVPGTSTSIQAGLSVPDPHGDYAVAVQAVGTNGVTGVPLATNTPVIPQIELTTGTVVLSQTTMNAVTALKAVTYNAAPALRYTFALNSGLQNAVGVGTVVVGPPSPTAPRGILARVVALQRTTTSVLLTATAVKVADAYKNLSFSYSGNPLAQPGASVHAASAGVRAASLSTKLSAGFDLSVGNDIVSIAGQAEFEIDLKANADIHTFAGVIPTGATIGASAEVTGTASVMVKFSGNTVDKETSIPIAVISPNAPILIPGTPLFFLPKVPVYLAMNGEMSVGVYDSFSLGASVTWNSNDPNNVHMTNDTPPKPSSGLGGTPLSGYASDTVFVGLEADPVLDIEDVGGPEVSLELGFQATAQTKDPYFEVSLALIIKAGIKIDLGGAINVNEEVTLSETHPLGDIYKIDTPPADNLIVTPPDHAIVPGVPYHFSARHTDGSPVTSPVQWSMAGQVRNDSLLNGTFVAANPPGRTVQITAYDASDKPTTMTVYISPAFAAPTITSATEDQAGTTLTASWTPPPRGQTGGAPIAGYIVTTLPVTATTILPASTTTASIAVPSSTTLYQVQVAASNTKGQVSPYATQLTKDQVTKVITTSMWGDTCGIYRSGHVRCWGFNPYGELGLGETTFNVATATLVPGPPGSRDSSGNLSGVLDAGSNGEGYGTLCFTIAPDNHLVCAGDNYNGELGVGSSKSQVSSFTNVVGPSGTGVLADVAKTVVLPSSTCALTNGGNVLCWGFNSHGELGNGTVTNSSIPVYVLNANGSAPLSGITQIVPHGPDGACALSSGNVFCWGQLVTETTSGPTTTDLPVEMLTPGTTQPLTAQTSLFGTTDLLAGAVSCSTDSSATATCWGADKLAALNATELVPQLNGVASIASDGVNECALLSSGSVRCWGNNSSGDLGNGVASGPYIPPTNAVTVLDPSGTSTLGNARSLSSSLSSYCVTTSSGAVDCWGYNSNNQLGIGGVTSPPTAYATPVVVLGTGNTPLKVTELAGSQESYTALTTSGNIYFWGSAGENSAPGAPELIPGF